MIFFFFFFLFSFLFFWFLIIFWLLEIYLFDFINLYFAFAWRPILFRFCLMVQGTSKSQRCGKVLKYFPLFWWWVLSKMSLEKLTIVSIMQCQLVSVYRDLLASLMMMLNHSHKWDPRTCAIFIPAWGSNWGSLVSPVIKIIVVRQVRTCMSPAFTDQLRFVRADKHAQNAVWRAKVDAFVLRLLLRTCGQCGWQNPKTPNLSSMADSCTTNHNSTLLHANHYQT